MIYLICDSKYKNLALSKGAHGPTWSTPWRIKRGDTKLFTYLSIASAKKAADQWMKKLNLDKVQILPKREWETA